MAKKKAAKKTAAPRVKRAPKPGSKAWRTLMDRLERESKQAAEDARIADEKKRAAVLEEIKGIVREVLDDERKDTINYAQERFHGIVADVHYASPDEHPGERLPHPLDIMAKSGPFPFDAAKVIRGPELRAPSTSPVSAHFDELYASMMKLGETINLLEDRLEPVLRTGADGPSLRSEGRESVAVALPTNCQVSIRANDTRSQAEAFRARVDDLLSRLQV